MRNLSKIGILCVSMLSVISQTTIATEQKTEALIDHIGVDQTLSILNTTEPDIKVNTGKLDNDVVPAVLSDNEKIENDTNKNTEIDIKSGIASEDETSEFTGNINEFFKKYKHPEFLMIMECDGLTQSIHLSNTQKALVNLYWQRHKDLGLLKKVNKWVGISYGCTLAGADVGRLANSKNVDEYNHSIDEIIAHLKQDRIDQNSCCTKFTNCLFNCCLCCFNCCAKENDIDIIRASQFDRATPSALQFYIKHYFPCEVLGHLIFLQSGKDRRRIDPNYQSSYVSAIEAVNNTAKKNNRGVVRKNVGFITDKVANITDDTDIPVVGKIAEVAGKIITNNVEFKSIDNSKNITAYQEMSGEVLEQGTFKIIINVDNADANDLSCDLRIEHKKDANKLKYRFTISIPTLSYQNIGYDFDGGYKKIIDYLNEARVKHYLTPMFDYINNITKLPHKNKNK